jgi:hypothetical protein
MIEYDSAQALVTAPFTSGANTATDSRRKFCNPDRSPNVIARVIALVPQTASPK